LPSFSRSLEQALHRALALAGERRHEYATLEHLLLALVDDQDAAAVMRACNVEVDTLKRSLVGTSTPSCRTSSGTAARTPSRPPASSA